MFQLIKGASIKDISGLREEYHVVDNMLCANVSAENIIKVFDAFLNRIEDDEPLFLFIEAPCNQEDESKLNSQKPDDENAAFVFHKDVYYLDGCNREDIRALLHSGAGEVLINDGLVCFGFGSFNSNTELGKYKYNVLKGFVHGQDTEFLTDIFDKLSIPRVSEIVTAWSLFSEDNYGESRRYEFEGKDIYTLIEQMEELGLYKAETREEDA